MSSSVNSPCDAVPFPQTICDYVVKTSIIKWDGTRVNLTRDEDPEGFANKIVHFGLLGVTVCELAPENICGIRCWTVDEVHMFGKLYSGLTPPRSLDPLTPPPD